MCLSATLGGWLMLFPEVIRSSVGEPFPRPIGDMNKEKHDGDFCQYTNRCGDGGRGVRSKQGDGNGDGQLKEVGGVEFLVARRELQVYAASPLGDSL